MSLLSSFVPFSGGGINSIQTGYINANRTGSTGTLGTEDYSYYDITISSITTSKAVPDFFGAANPWFGAGYSFYSSDNAAGNWMGIAMPRFTSATNLRLGMNNASSNYFGGRWYVIEAK